MAASCRGLHIGIGEKLVPDYLTQAKAHGFRVMQLNAAAASSLYERLGFVPPGASPGRFCLKDGHCEDLCPFCHLL